MAMFVLATDGTHQYRCHGCGHRCQTWNHGETFCINSDLDSDNNAIFLKKGEYAPCGAKLTLGAKHCRYCGSPDIAYQDGEIVACSRCYAQIQSIFSEPSVQTSVGLERAQAAQFPETLYTADFGTFSLSRILPNGEAVYVGNELVTQGYEIRLADMGDYLAGLRNFPVSDNDDFLSNFDKNGKEII